MYVQHSLSCTIVEQIYIIHATMKAILFPEHEQIYVLYAVISHSQIIFEQPFLFPAVGV